MVGKEGHKNPGGQCVDSSAKGVPLTTDANVARTERILGRVVLRLLFVDRLCLLSLSGADVSSCLVVPSAITGFMLLKTRLSTH